MRLLLVEDDIHLGKATTEGLEVTFAVDWVQSAEDAEEAILTTDYALIVLDINLPGISGLEFLEKIRASENNIPVLLLTALDALRHKVKGLNSGADDYLIKPFDLDELLARCSALIRRSMGTASPIISHQELSYDTATKHLQQNGETIFLSQRESAVFDCLITNINRTISKSKIEESIYGWSSQDIESNTIEVYVAALRRKLGKDLIKTIRGVGYSITK